jgi:hypothetical protein
LRKRENEQRFFRKVFTISRLLCCQIAKGEARAIIARAEGKRAIA